MRSSRSAPVDGLIAPPPPAVRAAFLRNARYAHRGLHGDGRIENSRAAFAAAIAAGDGIECDVRLSLDGIVYVFHDATLDRLTPAHGPIEARTSSELDRIRLAHSDETLPRLTDLLALVAGRVPLLIEIKTEERRPAAICLAVRYALEGYRGPAAVMSFNPQVGRWYAAHAPRIVRGLVVTEEGRRGWRGTIGRRLAVWRSRPDFLAYDVRDLPSRFAAAQRSRGLPVLSWTVRDAASERTARQHADAPIYELAAAR